MMMMMMLVVRWTQWKRVGAARPSMWSQLLRRPSLSRRFRWGCLRWSFDLVENWNQFWRVVSRSLGCSWSPPVQTLWKTGERNSATAWRRWDLENIWFPIMLVQIYKIQIIKPQIWKEKYIYQFSPIFFQVLELQQEQRATSQAIAYSLDQVKVLLIVISWWWSGLWWLCQFELWSWNGHRKDSTLLMITNINHDDHQWHNADHLSWRRWTCEVRFVKISTPWKRDATCQHRWRVIISSWWF